MEVQDKLFYAELNTLTEIPATSMRKIIALYVLPAILLHPAFAQENTPDSLDKKEYRLHYKHLIIPAAFISYGIGSLASKDIRQLNLSTRHEINEHRPDHIRLDNYTQYIPAAMVYGLNAAGIKGEHNFRDRSVIYGTSQLFVAAITIPVKHLVKEERPDGSNFLSFPSGHTATAFSSAWFMYKEYHKEHFWLSMSGFSLAAFTGVYRTLNDKHWVGDVVAGAGIGILSTELSYWLFPRINSMLGHSRRRHVAMVLPYVQQNRFGIGLVEQL